MPDPNSGDRPDYQAGVSLTPAVPGAGYPRKHAPGLHQATL
jgi:hypothetical protein